MGQFALKSLEAATTKVSEGDLTPLKKPIALLEFSTSLLKFHEFKVRSRQKGSRKQYT